MKPRKIQKQLAKPEEVNVGKLIAPYISKWYLIFGSIGLMLLLCFFFIRFSIPRYEISSRVLLRVDNAKKSNLSLDILDGEPYVSNSSSLEDEMEIFKAHSVLAPIVDSLNLQVTVFAVGENSRMRRAEVYKNLPFSIQLIDQSGDEYKSFSFKLIWGKDKHLFSFNDREIEFEKDTVIFLKRSLPKIRICAAPSQDFVPNIEDEYEISVVSKEVAMKQLENGIKIEKSSKESNIVNISMQGNDQYKITLTINHLIQSYQRDVTEDRSQIKINTISFIEDRMRYLVKELDFVEKSGESYKVTTGINDYTTNLNNSLSNQSSVEVKLKESEIQLSLTKYLSDYLEKANTDGDLLPTNLGLSDQTINSLIDQFNKILLEKSKLAITSKTNNPLIINLENQAKLLRNNIDKSLRNLRKSTQSKVDEYQNMINGLDGELKNLPKFEREYRSILRQQQIKETLYLYLLQKREENEIELAANTSSLKILSPPSNTGVLVYPKKSILYVGSAILGVLIPVFVIYILSLLSNKITHDTSVSPFTEIGSVPNTQHSGLITNDTKDGYLVESFKSIRTNLSFYLGDNKKIIGVTSALPDEGKTFISINIAKVISQTGKKVVLIGTDLRRSGAEIFFDNLPEHGLSTYLTRTETTVKDVIAKIDDNLFFIAKGISPPNPSELLLRPRMDQLIEELKGEFDIIVIDTSPVDVVSDCLPILKKYADFVLFVVKCGSTPKDVLKTPKRLIDESIVENIAIVKNNSIRQTKSYYGNYYYQYSGNS